MHIFVSLQPLAFKVIQDWFGKIFQTIIRISHFAPDGYAQNAITASRKT